jgi:putative transposase
LESFATLANGQRIFTPAYYRKAEAYLRRCQRRVVRRQKGSYRRKKAVVLLAKAHQQIARQRQDFHHKAALKLVRHYDTIYYEDLRVGDGASGQSRVHQPDVFCLWCDGFKGLAGIAAQSVERVCIATTTRP